MRTNGIEDVYELSGIQEGLLFHNLYSPGSGIYLEQITLTLRGELDVTAFRAAWQSIVDRHAILRTSFHWEGVGKALQVVHRQVELDLPEQDWREHGPEEQLKRFERYARDDRMAGFAFDVAPLMRTALIRVADDTWWFFWSFSHLLLDGWSFGLCFFELTHLYNAAARGEQPTLDPPRRYRDYIAWWKRQDPARARAFWAEHLAGFEHPGPLELGSVDRRPPEPGEPSHGMLPDRDLVALVPALSEVARANGLTVNTICQGAWMLLLGRYLDADDVIAGSTGTQRPSGLAGAEMIMGPMLATMPVRARIDPDAPLVGWLRGLQQEMARARDHAEIPLPELRGLAALPPGAPLFDMDLAYENVPVPDMTLEGVEIVESTYDGRPHFPITMIVMPGERLPVPRLVYDRTRFPDAAAGRLIEHFYTALTAIVENPDRTLGEIPVLPAAERERLVSRPAVERELPAPVCLHDRFAEQLRRNPSATALVCGDERLDYAELDRRANRLAHLLVARGAAPEERIGLCLERSLDTVVAVLAVLKSGAAYVPLDLAQPATRMEHILRDARVRLLVTHAAAADRAPAFDGPVVDLTADAGLVARQPSTVPEHGAGPGSLAYVIYTSGSTGVPKGVQVTHACVARLVAGAASCARVGPDDVWSLFHSYAFDVSVFEMWGAFGTGASLVVVPRETARDPEALLDLVRAEGVTVFSQTPSAFGQFASVAVARDADLPLRYVLFAGEALDVDTLAGWIARYGEDTPELVNLYGITEVTVHATWHRVTAEALSDPVSGRIGRPLPDLRIHVLDRHGRPAPLGVRGEMYVAGPGVARGYQNLPELTAERFVPDPFDPDPDARMYRSGDLARVLEDGGLEFLGRIDQQVQVRGFRVEPGEVETVLRGLPGVSEAVVAVDERAAGDSRLTAWLVMPGTDDDPTLSERVRAEVRERLPEYMVPSAVVRIDRVPLTPNGKTDRAALPAPGGARPACAGAHVAPRGPREQAACAVWADVLGVERVGVHDDFFALGGHSLLATRVAFRLAADLGVDVPVRAVFDRPSVAALVAGLDEARPAAEPAIGRAARVPYDPDAGGAP